MTDEGFIVNILSYCDFLFFFKMRIIPNFPNDDAGS